MKGNSKLRIQRRLNKKKFYRQQSALRCANDLAGAATFMLNLGWHPDEVLEWVQRPNQGDVYGLHAQDCVSILMSGRRPSLESQLGLA